MESIIEQVTAYATKAHGTQQRKYTPEPYIVHPIRVMKICAEYANSIPVLSAALLHDVLEDTPVTEDELLNELRNMMAEAEAVRTTELVVELTDVYIKASYPQWNRRKRKQMEAERISNTSADAQTIKYADIIDNSIEIIKYDAAFGPKFLRECQLLLSKMHKGNKDLYDRAVEIVKENLASRG